MRHLRRRFVACLLLLSLVFAQLATVLHACPIGGEPASAPPAVAQHDAPCPDGMPVRGDVSALCIEHCKLGQQRVDTPPPLQPVAVLPASILPAPSPFVGSPARAEPVAPVLARAAAPPVFVSSARLRI